MIDRNAMNDNRGALLFIKQGSPIMICSFKLNNDKNQQMISSFIFLRDRQPQQANTDFDTNCC